MLKVSSAFLATAKAIAPTKEAKDMLGAPLGQPDVEIKSAPDVEMKSEKKVSVKSNESCAYCQMEGHDYKKCPDQMYYLFEEF